MVKLVSKWISMGDYAPGYRGEYQMHPWMRKVLGMIEENYSLTDDDVINFNYHKLQQTWFISVSPEEAYTQWVTEEGENYAAS